MIPHADTLPRLSAKALTPPGEGETPARTHTYYTLFFHGVTGDT